MQTAINAIYRDLDYARSLIKARADLNAGATAAGASGGATGGGGEDDDELEIEETWTFIGDDADGDLKRALMEAGANNHAAVAVGGGSGDASGVIGGGDGRTSEDGRRKSAIIGRAPRVSLDVLRESHAGSIGGEQAKKSTEKDATTGSRRRSGVFGMRGER